MKNKVKKRILALIAAVMLCMAAFPLTAYAGGGEEQPPAEPPAETVAEPTPEPAPEPTPFTPDGTGTVVDYVTEADGKRFYVITTPSENIFYLIIDLDRDANNVYFLDAVTEKDLLALAEASGDADAGAGGVSAIPDTPAEVKPTTEPEVTPTPDPEPEKGGNMGMIIFVVAVVLVGGGAAYYFKVYRPKQEQADMGDDYGEYAGDDDVPWPGDEDAPPEDDGPPWYDEDEAREDYEATGEGEDA